MKEIVLQNFWFIIFAMAMLTLVLIYIVLTLIGYKPKDAIKPMLAAVFYIAIFVLVEAVVCRIVFGKTYEYYVGYYLFYLFAAYVDYKPRDLIRSGCITIILSIVLIFGGESKESLYEFLINFSIGFTAINFTSMIFISLHKLINLAKNQRLGYGVADNMETKTASMDKENNTIKNGGNLASNSNTENSVLEYTEGASKSNI
jgi:membrane protein